MDVGLPLIDDGYDLPPAEVGLSSDQYRPQDISSVIAETSSSVAAPQRRKVRVPKVIKVDRNIELRNRELLTMNNDYLRNMANDQSRTHAFRAGHQAKKNAEYWLLGRGLGNVGHGIGSSKTKGPLADIFSGASLYQWITGSQLGVAGRKRESEVEDTTDTERRVRPRLDNGDQISRGGPADFIDDGIVFQGDETEMGREAPEALEDISSAMPWNISASIRGSVTARGQPGAVGGTGSATGSLGRRGSRMVSASPLVGRGRPSGLEPFGGPDLTSEAMLGGDMGDFYVPAVDPDFELYGPGAVVDTQTAAQGSWQAAVLDRESNNFLDFVENTIGEKRKIAQELDPTADVNDVEFEVLLSPATNSIVVAAQALLHVLTLGTKNLISVKQQEHYGSIQLRLVGSM
jgi:meiotic recombination protein REC8, fungi type